MFRRILAVVGVVLFLASLTALIGAAAAPPPSPSAAPPPPPPPNDTVPQNAPPCRLDKVKASRSTVYEKESLDLIVSLSTDSNRGCRDTLYLDAPNFEASNTDLPVSIKANQTKDYPWGLASKEAGEFRATVATSTERSEPINILVKKKWSEYLPSLSTLGTLFGPMLTVPYWLDKWRGRKSREKQTRIRE